MEKVNITSFTDNHSMKLWDKGYSVHKEIEAFTIGKDLEFDVFLAPYDILGSIAHAIMLKKTGLISGSELSSIVSVLHELYHIVVQEEFTIDQSCEDIHSWVELVLTKKIGEAGKRIHTGRSRNDQSLLDIKLFLRHQLFHLASSVKDAVMSLLQLGEQYKDIIIPGYTHLQIAMPSSFGLWFGAYAESLTDDLLTVQSAYRFVNRNPLGSAAGYGSSFPLDRALTTDLLGFEGLNISSVYAQMTRGKSELIVSRALSGIAQSISKMAMDITLYTSQNFGFMSLPQEFTTGSSIMPHKKNPDVFELIRAKCNRISAIHVEISGITTNLPSGYHRDYQITKEILFPAFTELSTCMSLLTIALQNSSYHQGITQDKKYELMYTVDSVNELVQQGISFREAYMLIGQKVQQGEYQKPKHMNTTHIGSINNPGLQEIQSYCIAEYNKFNFEKAESAEKQLLDKRFIQTQYLVD